MKTFSKILALLCLSFPAFAANEGFNTFVNGLSAAPTLTGTEKIPCAPSTTTLYCTPAQMATYVGGNLPSGSVTLAQQANLAASSIPCNPTTSAAAQQACDPLTVSNLLQLGTTVNFTAVTNLSSLSGSVTFPNIFGTTVNPADGSLVLLIAETSVTGPTGCTNAACNGIWQVHYSGNWTRVPTFPNGQIIAAGCAFIVTDTNSIVPYVLNTLSAITIDTTAQSWNPATSFKGTYGSGSTNGSNFVVGGGIASGTGNGGNAQVIGGAAANGNGGNAPIFGGAGGTNGNGGSVNIRAGLHAGSGTDGNVLIGPQAAGFSPTGGNLQVTDILGNIDFQLFFVDGGVTVSNAGSAPTGGDEGAGTINVARGIYDNGLQVHAALTGTTSAIGGSALTNTCSTGTATVTGATSSMLIGASPVSDPGGNFNAHAWVSSSNTVTVSVCGTGTPNSVAYNVRAVQ